MYWTLSVGSDINAQNCAMRDYGDIYKDAVSGTTMETWTGTQYHYVFTFEDGVGFFADIGGRMTFYRDGFQIGWRDVPFRLQDLEDVNNWLGRSQWSWDSNSNVEYDELRIYSEALSWYDIYGHYVAGPDVPVNEAPSLDIAVEGSSSCRVSWPGNTVGFSLKKAAGLSGMNPWLPVTNEVQNSSQGLRVSIPRVEGEEYYRLEK